MVLMHPTSLIRGSRTRHINLINILTCKSSKRMMAGRNSNEVSAQARADRVQIFASSIING